MSVRRIKKSDRVLEAKKIKSGQIFGEDWVVDCVVGQGSFGTIFSCKYIKETDGKVYAMKLELRDDIKAPLKVKEYFFLEAMKNAEGFPKLVSFGYQGIWAWTVMTLLGPSLELMFRYCDQRFSLITIVKIGCQVLSRIEDLHNRGLLHRDIKPDNLLLGFEKTKSIIHLVDFGLSRSYLDEYGRHIAKRTRLPLIGTARYASLNTHRGIQQSRRDDIESLWYTLVYLFSGSLPWMKAAGTNVRLRQINIYHIKVITPASVLCKNLPEEFELMIEYIRGLKFAEKPDYGLIRMLLHQSLPSECRGRVDLFDWEQKMNAAED